LLFKKTFLKVVTNKHTLFQPYARRKDT